MVMLDDVCFRDVQIRNVSATITIEMIPQKKIESTNFLLSFYPPVISSRNFPLEVRLGRNPI